MAEHDVSGSNEIWDFFEGPMERELRKAVQGGIDMLRKDLQEEIDAGYQSSYFEYELTR
jgi:hypothetical protein